MTSTDLLLAACALAALALIAFTLLRGWQGWLAFKNRELDLQRVGPGQPGHERNWHDGAARIELSDLKERIRKLEAIANGVDL